MSALNLLTPSLIYFGIFVDSDGKELPTAVDERVFKAWNLVLEGVHFLRKRVLLEEMNLYVTLCAAENTHLPGPCRSVPTL